MEGERPHRSGSSELFICFTSRPSSSSSSFMRITSKSIHSPGRPDKFRDGSSSLHTSLSRRLRHNGSLKGGQASPMFPTTAKKKGCAFDTPEPTSPKVTCIGQVRVKTKKQGKKIRARSKKRGELSFRRTQEGKDREDQADRADRAEEEGRLERRHQRWVSLPLSICEALRAFGADFNCFQPCGGRSPCASSEIDREKGEKRSTTTTTGTCGAVFARWLMALHEGDEGKRRGLQEQVVLAVEDRAEREEEEIEEAVDAKRGGEHCEEKVFLVEDENVPVCIPPKNALLLMRCRSEPFRMASYAHRFWESPAPKDAEEDDDEDEEEVDPCEQVEMDVEEAEEDHADVELGKEHGEETALVNIVCHDALQASEDEMVETSEVETGDNGELSLTEEEDPVEGVSASELVEEPVTGKSSSPEFVEEPLTGKSFLPEFVEEPVTEESSSPDLVEEPVTEKSCSAEFVEELIVEAQEADSTTPESVVSEVEEISWGEAPDEPEDPAEETEDNGELQRQRSEHEVVVAAAVEDEVEEEEEVEEETDSPKTEGDEEKVKTVGQTNLVSPEPRVFYETDETNGQSQVKGQWNEEEDIDRCSSSSFAASSAVQSEEELIAIPTGEAEVTKERKPAGVEEEKSRAETSAEVVEKEEDGGDQRGGCGGDRERKEENDDKSSSLPECLLMMLCEPKLSMEVSKETWVCSTDFLRWRPERKQPKLTKEAVADDRRRLSTDSNLAKPPPPAMPLPPPPKPNAVGVQALPSVPSRPSPAPPSMAAAVEQKLVNASAYEPFVLTRCKSEPMRSSAKLAPEACFWKSRKLQQHPVRVGAAGIGV